MTTPSPTNNHVAGLGGFPPSGLPNEATVMQWAQEFFATLPAGPRLPAPDIATGSSLADNQRETRRKDSTPPIPTVEALAGMDAIMAGRQATTTLNPRNVPEPVKASSPGNELLYYFMGEISPQLTEVAVPQAEASILAQSMGLPGTGELAGLLADNIGKHPAMPAKSSMSPRGFYFLEADGAIAQAWASNPAVRPPLDVHAIRRDFPILSEQVNNRPLVWFDNAATTHKPQVVVDRISQFYLHENSNIHRAAHTLAARATDAYESARQTVARFLGAASSEEIVFVRGATEGINLVAQAWGRQNIGAGDEIVISLLEHHANIVPWQLLATEKKAKLRVIPVDDSGQIRLDEYKKLLNERTRLVAITQVSNALGTITPVREIAELAHEAGATVLVDGAQAVSHRRVDVRALDADFYVFSGHKVFGPTGIGVLYGKRELLAAMPPWQGGGNMIADVTLERTLYQEAPGRFEAGTGSIADAAGLAAAIDYVENIGLENIARYEQELLDYATRSLSRIPEVRLVGTAREKASVASFVLKGYRAEEVGSALNEEGIAVRSSHHCAQPILRRFGLEATVRPSFAFYNTCEEIDRLVAVVHGLVRWR